MIPIVFYVGKSMVTNELDIQIRGYSNSKQPRQNFRDYDVLKHRLKKTKNGQSKSMTKVLSQSPEWTGDETIIEWTLYFYTQCSMTLQTPLGNFPSFEGLQRFNVKI